MEIFPRNSPENFPKKISSWIAQDFFLGILLKNLSWIPSVIIGNISKNLGTVSKKIIAPTKKCSGRSSEEISGGIY